LLLITQILRLTPGGYKRLLDGEDFLQQFTVPVEYRKTRRPATGKPAIGAPGTAA
jgi:hypothetical protein